MMMNSAFSDKNFKRLSDNSRSYPASRAGSVAGSGAGSAPVSRRSSLSDSMAGLSLNPSSAPASASVPAAAMSVATKAYGDTTASYPGRIEASTVQAMPRPTGPVQSVQVNMTNVAAVGGTASEVERVKQELNQVISHVREQLKDEINAHTATVTRVRHAEEHAQVIVAQNQSLQEAMKLCQQKLDDGRQSVENLTKSLYDERERCRILEERCSLAESKVEELELASAQALSMIQPPPPPDQDGLARANHELREEITALKAALASKDERIQELEAKLLVKDAFVMVPLQEGVTRGLVVYPAMAQMDSAEIQRVNISFAPVSDGALSVRSEDAQSRGSGETGASCDPALMPYETPVIKNAEFVAGVKAVLTNTGYLPSPFVSKLLKLEKCDEVLAALITDLSDNDVQHFTRPSPDNMEQLVNSFADDIKIIALNPAVYDEAVSRKFCSGEDVDGDLSIIPPGVPSKYFETFIDTRLDPEHDSNDFHKRFVEQYLNWGTDTGVKIRGLLLHLNSAAYSVSESASLEITDSGSSDGSSVSVDSITGHAQTSRGWGRLLPWGSRK